jgi:polyhydroxybutyrate depolymerase
MVIVLGVLASGCTGESDQAAFPTTVSSVDPETTAPSAAPTTIETTIETNPPTTIETTVATTASTVAAATTTSVSAVCGDVAVGVTEFTLTAGGADHPVRVFVPSVFDGGRLPTVLNWHGLGGNGPDHAAVTRYEALAEAEGFIVVHPTGLPDVGDSRNSWQLATSNLVERDDVAFADGLIDHLLAEWCTDSERVYATGMSNGGFFTARLVCELADRLAAASSVGGLYHPDGCVPARPVPYLGYHGTDDTIVPFDGDGESLLLGGQNDAAMRVFTVQVIPEEFAEFAADASCSKSTVVSTIGDVIRYDYSGCVDGTPMSFFEVTGGGHTWPNWPIADAVQPRLGYTTTDADATVDSWEFFRQHTLTG